MSGWKAQERSSAAAGSSTTRMQLPLDTCHSLAVPSNETERIRSLEMDHAKSIIIYVGITNFGKKTSIPVTPLECPSNMQITVAGDGITWHMEMRPSMEQQAKRDLSSYANLTALMAPVCWSNI